MFISENLCPHFSLKEGDTRMVPENRAGKETTGGQPKETRRNFLSLIGWGSLLSALGLCLRPIRNGTG